MSLLKRADKRRFILLVNCGFSATEVGLSVLARHLGFP